MNESVADGPHQVKIVGGGWVVDGHYQPDPHGIPHPRPAPTWSEFLIRVVRGIRDGL